MKFRLSSEPILLAFVFNFSIMVTVIPQLFLEKECLLKYDVEICANMTAYPREEEESQKAASYWEMAFFLCTNVIGFLGVLIWGPLTDIIGRRKGFIYICVSIIVTNLILVVNVYYEELQSSYMLFIAVTNGFYGDISGEVALCYAHMADTTDESTRTMRMVLLESSFYLAFGISGVLSGVIIKRLGYIFVPIINSVIAFLLIFYILFYLETPQKKEENEDTPLLGRKEPKKKWQIFVLDNISVLNPISHLKEVATVLYTSKARCYLLLMYVIYFCTILAVSSDEFLSSLYVKNSPFNGSSEMVGYYIGFTGFAGFLGALLSFYFVYKFNVKDEWLLAIGLLIQCACYTLTGLSRTYTILMLSRCFQFITPILLATIFSYTTKLANNESKHGTILSGLQSLDVLSCIIASFIVGYVYSFTMHIHSGLSFFVLAVISLIALVVFVVLLIFRRRDNKNQITISNFMTVKM